MPRTKDDIWKHFEEVLLPNGCYIFIIVVQTETHRINMSLCGSVRSICKQ